MDEEKIQLVAIETDNGVHYDLWYPGYVWADKKVSGAHLGLCSQKTGRRLSGTPLARAIKGYARAE